MYKQVIHKLKCGFLWSFSVPGDSRFLKYTKV